MNERDKHTELIELVHKKMTGEATSENLDRLTVLLAEDSAHQSLYDEQVQLWSITEKAKGISSQEVQEEWNRLDRAMDQLEEKSSSIPVFKIAAAVAFLIVSSIVAFQFWTASNFIEISASTVIEQQLDDGSYITLHAHAQLTYPKDYNHEKREVRLTGEAFFDVAENAEKPFIIHAENTDIKVLGTSFNVKAVESSPVTEVVVVTGKVQVTHRSDQVTLLPGEKAIVNRKTGKLFKIENDDPNFQSWRTKKFEFTNLALDEVVRLLSEAYQQPIKLKNQHLNKCPVTVSFDGQSLESIITVLVNTLDLSVVESAGGLVLDGTGCE
ncbi:MAG: FecR domain-containing protein [Reichenbachiella sp.]|uniref:FecR family protein n=1 Tax=Reichenbachiella sp. TaxID=2184521 RepID=UPI003265A3F6